jgi:NAD(P)H-dependent FMN reductase
MKVTIISGSPRHQSVTVRVAQYLLETLSFRYAQHNFELITMNHINLPFVENVWSDIHDVPEEHSAIAKKIFDADAFILISPEYNGAYSASMKNLLDHFPKQGKKVFGIVTASPGALGGIRAAQQMQNLICGLFGIPCPNMLTVGAVDKKFNAEGQLLDENYDKVTNGFMQDFMWQAEAIFEKKSSL